MILGLVLLKTLVSVQNWCRSVSLKFLLGTALPGNNSQLPSGNGLHTVINFVWIDMYWLSNLYAHVCTLLVDCDSCGQPLSCCCCCCCINIDECLAFCCAVQ